MARGNPKALSLGPGYLYLATLGSTEPVDLTATWDVAWIPLGYTEEGSSFSYAPSFEDVEVAEELDPMDSVATGRVISVSFALAEVTADNLKRAMNGGTITAGGVAPSTFSTFEPPDLGTEIKVALGYESEDHLERWVWRECKQTGTVEMQRRKGSAKTTIANEFKVFKPAAGGQPFKAIIADSRLA